MSTRKQDAFIPLELRSVGPNFLCGLAIVIHVNQTWYDFILNLKKNMS